MPGSRRPRTLPAAVPRRSLGAGLAALVLLLAVMGGLGAAPASAHAGLVRAVPGDGATVTTAPNRVRLVFDEDMRTPASIVVTGPSGGRVQNGRVRVLDNTATVRVDVTAAGRYRVAFRVVSVDGHPVAAQTSFRFAPGRTAQPGTARPSGDAEHAGHEAAADGGWSRGRVIGIAAGAGLLAGLALLGVRRMPGGIANPGRGSGRGSSP